MDSYPKAAMERAMKVQEVMLRAMAKKITWWQAAEIIGISDRHMRRWRERYEEFGFRGLFDRRRGKASPKKVPMAVVERVLGLYRDRYFDLNLRHFHVTAPVGQETQGRNIGKRQTSRRLPQSLERGLYSRRCSRSDVPRSTTEQRSQPPQAWRSRERGHADQRPQNALSVRAL